LKDSIHKYFYVGTVQRMTHPPEEIDVLDSIRTLGSDDFFDAVEISRFEDERSRSIAKNMLEQAHMKVCCSARILGTGLNPNDLNEEGRENAEKTLLEAVDEAQYLGAAGITFLSGKWERERRGEAYEQLLKTTRAVCDYAAKKNMTVELEVFDYDMDKAVLIGPAPYAQRFAADMRMTHSNFGLLADLSHFPTTHETSRFVVRTLRPYITHFHIGNAVVKKGCEAYGDKHPRFGFPNSANDVPELLDFFRVLKEEGFFQPELRYVLSMEVKPWKNEDAALVLAGTKRVIKRAWALLED
jgi:sugar phosphate isomerase/epimerase